MRTLRSTLATVPRPVAALLGFSFLTVALVFGALALALAGFADGHHSLSPYLGVVGGYPYLWIAVVTASTLRSGSRGGLAFARLVLAIGLVTGLVDLAVFGWSSGTPGEALHSSPWRFVWSWLVPAIWIAVISTPDVRRWEQALERNGSAA